jgi:hypothetical protein
MSTTWSSTTPSIQSEIILLGDNSSIETSGALNGLLLPWANRIVLEVCNEVYIREHLDTDDVAVTTAGYQYALPATAGSVFFKKHERFTKVRVGDDCVPIVGIDELFSKDPNHDDTSSGTTPDCVAIDGGYIYVYPMWTGTLTIENYFRYPVDMSTSTDNPDIPVEHLRTDLIVAGVLGKYVFPATGESQKALTYYNRSTRPPSGLFFDLLSEYKNYLKDNQTTWTNQVKYF